jgi:predicted amidohydrolase
MKLVKAAAVQMNAVLYGRDGSVEKVVRKIHGLGEQGVQFATFPEECASLTTRCRASLRLTGVKQLSQSQETST